MNLFIKLFLFVQKFLISFLSAIININIKKACQCCTSGKSASTIRKRGFKLYKKMSRKKFEKCEAFDILYVFTTYVLGPSRYL